MTISYRKLVMQSDLNPGGRLFGGDLLRWVDEAAALYAFCQLRSYRVVTLKLSESIFKIPVELGDFLEFDCTVLKFGKTSLTIHVSVCTKIIRNMDVRREVFATDVTFVSIDADGTPVAHGCTEVRT